MDSLSWNVSNTLVPSSGDGIAAEPNPLYAILPRTRRGTSSPPGPGRSRMAIVGASGSRAHEEYGCPTPSKILSADERDGRESFEPTPDALTALDWVWDRINQAGMDGGKRHSHRDRRCRLQPRIGAPGSLQSADHGPGRQMPSGDNCAPVRRVARLGRSGSLVRYAGFVLEENWRRSEIAGLCRVGPMGRIDLADG